MEAPHLIPSDQVALTSFVHPSPIADSSYIPTCSDKSEYPGSSPQLPLENPILVTSLAMDSSPIQSSGEQLGYSLPIPQLQSSPDCEGLFSGLYLCFSCLIASHLCFPNPFVYQTSLS